MYEVLYWRPTDNRVQQLKSFGPLFYISGPPIQKHHDSEVRALDRYRRAADTAITPPHDPESAPCIGGPPIQKNSTDKKAK